MSYEGRMSDWSSDVCSSDLIGSGGAEDAVDAAEIGTAAQIEDVEALELLELIFAVVVVKARDELERLADGRQDPHFLGELLEPLGKGVIDRIVGERAAAEIGRANV